MIIEELEIKYRNAKEWFHRNYDNPQERKRALEHYQQASDNYYAVKYPLPEQGLVDKLREAGL
jgi:hypothetical protein